MRSSKYYTLTEVGDAKYIVRSQGRKATANTLNANNTSVVDHGAEMVAWANKVLSWHRSFVTACRVFFLILGDYQMAVKGVWQCIKETIPVGQIVRDWRGHRRDRQKGYSHSHDTVHNRMTMKSRSGKYELRTKRAIQADRLQTITI